jgi:hypothetical protein
MEDEKTSSNEAPPSNITETGVNTIGLNSLQGKEQLELLNEIDKVSILCELSMFSRLRSVSFAAMVSASLSLYRS